MPPGSRQLIGWDEWQAKLQVCVKEVPRIAAIRGARAMQGVVRDGLITATAGQTRLPTRIKEIATQIIGTSMNRNTGDTQKVARVGYGVGRRKLLARKQGVVREKLVDVHGKRAVYRRYVATPMARRKGGHTIAAQIQHRLWLLKGRREAPRQVEARRIATAKAMAQRMSRRKGTNVGLARLKGSGLSKRNAHWLTFGTGKRRILSFFGTGRTVVVGPFGPYLMGILPGVLRLRGKAAYQAATRQFLLVQQAAMESKAKSTLRSLAKQAL